jgi:hypothetical protein
VAAALEMPAVAKLLVDSFWFVSVCMFDPDRPKPAEALRKVAFPPTEHRVCDDASL